MDTLLRVDNLSHNYEHATAVADLSFRLDRGSITALLGLNGAGKTTTLNLLAGCLPAVSGRVLLNGQPIDRPCTRRALGYLPERPPLFDELTVDESLCYSARVHGLRGSSLSAGVQLARQRCGLDRHGRKLVGRLSKGYRQRLGLAQAIVHQPALLILDEPTDGLDPAQIADTHALIRDLAEDCGVILSSHRLDEVRALANRALVLHHGQLLASAEDAEFDNLEALFLGLRDSASSEELAP